MMKLPTINEGVAVDARLVQTARHPRSKEKHVLCTDAQRFKQLFPGSFLRIHTRQINQPADPLFSRFFYDGPVLHRTTSQTEY